MRRSYLKHIKMKCRICGEINVCIEDLWLEDDPSTRLIPVELYTSPRQLGAWYKRNEGTTFRKVTGQRISDCFRKRCIENAAHYVCDESEKTLHKLSPFVAWVCDKGIM